MGRGLPAPTNAARRPSNRLIAAPRANIWSCCAAVICDLIYGGVVGGVPDRGCGPGNVLHAERRRAMHLLSIASTRIRIPSKPSHPIPSHARTHPRTDGARIEGEPHSHHHLQPAEDCRHQHRPCTRHPQRRGDSARRGEGPCVVHPASSLARGGGGAGGRPAHAPRPRKGAAHPART